MADRLQPLHDKLVREDPTLVLYGTTFVGIRLDRVVDRLCGKIHVYEWVLPPERRGANRKGDV